MKHTLMGSLTQTDIGTLQGCQCLIDEFVDSLLIGFLLTHKETTEHMITANLRKIIRR